MESYSYAKLLTNISLCSNMLPYFGYTDKCFKFMRGLCKETKQLWDKNELAMLRTILKHNKRKIMLSKVETYDHETFIQLLKYFHLKIDDLGEAHCSELLKILDTIERDRRDIELEHVSLECQFSSSSIGPKPSQLLERLIELNILKNEIIVIPSMLENLSGEKDISKHICLKLNSDCQPSSLSSKTKKITSMSYEHLGFEDSIHESFQKVISSYSPLTSLSLELYTDMEEDSDHFDTLFKSILDPLVSEDTSISVLKKEQSLEPCRKFTLNPYSKMRGFTIGSKEMLVYMKDRHTKKIICYKLHNIKFHYNSNCWSSEFYRLSSSVVGIKSIKNFSFENIEETTPDRRYRDLIMFFLQERTDEYQWIFFHCWDSKSQNPLSAGFDYLYIRDKFEGYQDLFELNVKILKIAEKVSIAPRENDDFMSQPLSATSQLCYILYQCNGNEKSKDIKDIKMKPVSIFIDWLYIDRRDFHSICNLVRNLPDTIYDATISFGDLDLNAEFIRTLRGRNSLDRILLDKRLAFNKDIMKELPMVAFCHTDLKDIFED
ncbi:unnamed protein product [Moneuplotes crassus]|uniref:Uncharacterized protein n=1 Tax=Euplotes crassus TaxID=5936 RepID=A0AAD1UD39_EUPCR|nr:unnamed protein product [Moneuplotes crassus]